MSSRQPGHGLKHGTASERETLKAMIENLPVVDLTNRDIQSLILQFVLEVPAYDPDRPASVHFERCKLEAFNLLINLQKSASSNKHDEYAQHLMNVLKTQTSKPEESPSPEPLDTRSAQQGAPSDGSAEDSKEDE